MRRMFAQISRRYDFLNHLLSLNLDRGWRRRLVRRAVARRPRRILDLATGTGDLAALLRARLPRALVAGADACLPMLQAGLPKVSRAARAGSPVHLVGADALALPFRDGSFDLVSVAFGIRNFADLAGGLSEIRRVLCGGGTLLALEFSLELRPGFAPFYLPYFRHVLPAMGRVVSGTGAYRYLAASVEGMRAPAAVRAEMERCGLLPARLEPLAGGSVVLYEARAA